MQMFHKVEVSRIEIGAYLTLIAGVLGDQLSTTYALTQRNIFETNPFALTLMNYGLWSTSNFLLILISISATFISLRVLQQPTAKYLVLLPAFAGAVRIAVTFWNLHLII